MEFNNLEKYNINPSIIEEYIRKIREQESIIVVTGEFSSGKTCFVNAYLNKKNYLPHANGECTPVLIDIMRSSDEFIVVKYKNGEEIRIEATEENIRKYAKYTKEYDLEILSISIPVNSDYLEYNTHFIDSPGTNTIIKEHEEITRYILKKSDIVIYVFNKAISQSDIVNIKEILKYTDDIIFVITHMDVEKDTEYIYREEDEIDRFIKEAKDQIRNSLKIDEPEIYPIGSRASYKNEKYINCIRETVKQYCEINSLQIMKNRVKRQLSIIFDDKLKEYENNNKLLLSAISLDKEEIDERLKKFQDKITRVSKLEEQRIKNINESAMNRKIKLSSEIKNIFNDEEEKLIGRILYNNNVTKELITEEFSMTNTLLGEKVKDKLEKAINDLSIEVYDSISDEIKSVIETIDIELDTKIRKPTIEELDDTEHISEIEEIINNQNQILQQLKKLEDNIERSEAEKNEIRNSIDELNRDIEEYKDEMRNLGYYIPEYREEILDGGGGAGAKLGRFVGEVADIALFFMNPSGGVAKAADAAKDTVKATSIIQKGVKATKFKPAKKNLSYKKHIDTAKNVIIKADNKRKKLVSYTEEIQDMPETSTTVVDGIGKVLDMLSLGYWGEKIGGALGEGIKPTSTILIENEEKKREWESQRDEIQYSIELNLRRQSELEASLRNVDTIKESLRLKRELEEKQRRYEYLKKELEQKFQYKKEIDFKEKVEQYYKTEISNLFEKESNKADSISINTFDTAIQRLIYRAEEDLKKKIDDLNLKIGKLKAEKKDIEDEIVKNNNIVEELRDYEKWIEEWVM